MPTRAISSFSRWNYTAYEHTAAVFILLATGLVAPRAGDAQVVIDLETTATPTALESSTAELDSLQQRLLEQAELIEELRAQLSDPDVGSCTSSAQPGSTAGETCDWRHHTLDNLSIFLGLEGSKQPQDFGVNAHFGGRFAINWGAPVLADRGLGVQVGTSINSTSNAVQVFERVASETGRTQSFTTAAIFQRTPGGVVWAIGYDFLHQDYYDDFELGQWRGRLGFQLNECHELGMRMALSDRDDTGTFLTIPLVLEPISQASFYWTRIWPTAGETTIWAGIAEGHSEANLALGDLPPRSEQFVFGAQLHLPLNDRLAIFGEANFVAPADTGTVDAYLGFVYYPSDDAFTALRTNFSPVLPVANNTSMSVDLSR